MWLQTLDQGQRPAWWQACPVAVVEAAIALGGFTLPVAEQGLDQVHLLADDRVFPKPGTAFAQRFQLIVEGEYVDLQWR
ncbi:hypothetical protein D3C76_1537650 [compost metagenome]